MIWRHCSTVQGRRRSGSSKWYIVPGVCWRWRRGTGRRPAVYWPTERRTTRWFPAVDWARPRSTPSRYAARTSDQWRWSVVKYGGQGQSPVKTLHRFRLPSSLWFCDFSKQSRFLTACRRLLEKLVLPSIFDTNLHPWWRETCRVIQQQFWMKECDIVMG